MQECLCNGQGHIYRSKKPLIIVWCNQCSIDKVDKSVGAKVINPVFGEGHIKSWNKEETLIKFKNGTYELDPREVQYVIDPKDYERIIGGEKWPNSVIGK